MKEVVALVSGGASGLGRATVEHLVNKGCGAVIVDRDVERGEALAKALGDTVRFVETDVTSAADVQKAIDAAAELGTLRVAVSCAGVGWAARTVNKEGEPHDLDLFQKIIGVNLVGTFNREPMALIVVNSSENQDVVTTSEGVIDYIERKASDLPEGVSLSLWWNSAELYEGRMNTIAGSALWGSLFVLIALVLFLRPIVAFWVTIGIIVAFLGSLLVLPMFGLLAASLVPAYGVPLRLDTLTLDKWHEVLFRQPVTTRAFANSFGLAAGAARAAQLRMEGT